MRIVMAPDSFKGTVSAVEAAAALARGWRSVRPDDSVVEVPMADGGEGTLDAFARSVPGSSREPVRVTGPLGDPHDAHWLRLPDGAGLVELASTSGITLVPRGGLRPLDASSRGFGEAIASALEAGADPLYLAIGSSCSTDGGAGALLALGAGLTDAAGATIAPGSRGLADLAAVDLSRLPALPPGGVLTLSDVTSPLLGPAGAAAVCGPQKGATADDIAVMEAALRRFADLMPGDPTTPGAGAAGGTGFGLVAWGARMASGADTVARAIGLPGALADADLVITGEGRYDEQSAAGKVVSVVAALAHSAATPVALVAGAIDAPADGFAGAVSLTEVAGSVERALQDPTPWLEQAAVTLARSLPR
jgi:glycerate kinase